MKDLLIRADTVEPEGIPDLLAEIEKAKAVLWQRLVTPSVNGKAPGSDKDFRLTPDEVASRLGVTKRWVYRHREELGGRRLSHRNLRFNEVGVRRYLARKAPD